LIGYTADLQLLEIIYFIFAVYSRVSQPQGRSAARIDWIAADRSGGAYRRRDFPRSGLRTWIALDGVPGKKAL
jgi:hypothetical protein